MSGLDEMYRMGARHGRWDGFVVGFLLGAVVGLVVVGGMLRGWW